MDKRSEQVGIKLTPEVKREIVDFCNRNNLTESEFGNMAILYFLTAYHTLGPVKMMGETMGALR